MVNGVPREVSRIRNVLIREKIEGPPRDFLKANPRSNRLLWVLAFGLTEDVAKGLL